MAGWEILGLGTSSPWPFQLESSSQKLFTKAEIGMFLYTITQWTICKFIYKQISVMFQSSALTPKIPCVFFYFVLFDIVGELIFSKTQSMSMWVSNHRIFKLPSCKSTSTNYNILFYGIHKHGSNSTHRFINMRELKFFLLLGSWLKTLTL
jgi:hypothetical protein